MKQIFVLLIVVATALSQDVFPGEFTFEDLVSDNNRIASGVKAKSGENQDYCYLNVNFIQKSQVCGCAIASDRYVVTSGRCIYDTQEGKATNATVTIIGLSGKAAIKLASDFIIPDGTNGADATFAQTLEKYDYVTDIPFKNIGPNNIGMVKLQTALTTKELDGSKVKKLTFISATDFDTFKTMYADYNIRVCGIGSVDNKGTKSKGLFCTDMEVKKTETCQTDTAADPEIPTESTICLYSNADNNICAGDYGGPAWAYKLTSDGKKMDKQEVFGFTVGSVNIRSNSPCLGGQTIVATFTPGKVQKWIEGVVAGRVVAAK